MSGPDLRTVMAKLPARESVETLQDSLKAVGVNLDLNKVPAGQVPRIFEEALESVLTTPIGKLPVAKILAIAQEVKNRSAALEKVVTADTILQGYKKLAGGVIEITLPEGISIQDLGKLLNAAAREKGIGPVFYEGNARLWAELGSDPELSTEGRRTYRFRIEPDSFYKTRAEQVRDHGKGAPLGAIAISEACERLFNNATLFKNTDGEPIWVRGSTPQVALNSYDKGVRARDNSDGVGASNGAFAACYS